MPKMIEVARLDFMMYRVTCLVAQDGSYAHILSVEIFEDGTEYVREEQLVRDVGYTAKELFYRACNNAMALYTRSEWTGSMYRKGVEI
jgi:hypothetical protein